MHTDRENNANAAFSKEHLILSAFGPLANEAAENDFEKAERRLCFPSADLVRAQEAERARVSSELHDELGQSLSLLKLRIRFIRKEIGARLPSLTDDVDETLGYLDGIIEDVRRLCQDLSPHVVEDLGLTAALKWLVLDFGKRNGITASLRLKGLDRHLSKGEENNIYRIIQEALTNIGKHAEARTIAVTAGMIGRKLRFSVKDDGKGFDPVGVGGQGSRTGLGMSTMAERVRMLGGSLEVRSRRGKGTIISFSLSLRDKAS